MFVSHHQTTGQNHYIKVAYKSFENVTKFKYGGSESFVFLAAVKNVKIRTEKIVTVPVCVVSVGVKLFLRHTAKTLIESKVLRRGIK
jgi:hypothetical protein